MRNLVLNTAAANKNSAVIDEAKRRFDLFLANETGQPIAGDQRDLIYRSVVRSGGDAYFFKMQNRYTTNTFPEEKRRCLYALTQANEQYLLRYLLQWAINDTNVRIQDTVRVISYVAANPNGRDIAWSFFRANWAELNRRYGGGGFAIDSLVTAVTSGYASQQKVDEVTEWFAKNPVPSASRSIDASIEQIKSNANWLSRNADPVCNWVSQQV
eukprot:TRINITY_DN408_c4_g1_i1.p2 TRINITY_DN408_c4_g1~~TRINITY_DN408_c4_g1_i1.p2  ORF type:complete len:213 (+),score=84.55 TRINITY_DN408_c4_g1_i1:1021-1659(+)